MEGREGGKRRSSNLSPCAIGQDVDFFSFGVVGQGFQQTDKCRYRLPGMKHICFVLEEVFSRRPGKGNNNGVLTGIVVILGALGCGPVKVAVGPMDVDGQVLVNPPGKNFIYIVKEPVGPC